MTAEDLNSPSSNLRYDPIFIIKGYFLTESQGDWLATGIDSGSKFTAIDLTEGEWFDYDEKAGEEVSIKDLKWEIRRN